MTSTRASSGTADVDIIEAVLRGEVNRYGELIERYQQTAWQVAYGLVGNFEDAKEISQNGFIKAYQCLRRFRREAKFSTWLYRIIVNECKDFFRRQARRPKRVTPPVDSERDDQVLFEAVDPRANPRDEVAERELAARLSDAIQALSLKQRTVFLLHHVQGMSLGQVAEVMGCQLGTVKAHLFRATEHLRVTMEPFIEAKVNA